VNHNGVDMNPYSIITGYMNVNSRSWCGIVQYISISSSISTVKKQ
jgi:hypothetical protein